MKSDFTSRIQFEGSLHFQSKDRSFIVGDLEGNPAVFIDRWRDLFFLYKKLRPKKILNLLGGLNQQRPLNIQVFLILKNKILGSLRFSQGHRKLQLSLWNYFFGDPVL